MSNLRVFIPTLPPGINKSYGVTSISGKAEMYKTSEANDWAAKAALILGSKAAEIDWKDDSKFYEISVIFHNMRGDVDGPIKLIMDVVATKLDFNDKRIKRQSSEKIESDQKGVWIELKPYV